MSLRAIKKRDSPLSTTTTIGSNAAAINPPSVASSLTSIEQANRRNLFRKSTTAGATGLSRRNNTSEQRPKNRTYTPCNSIQQQQALLERATQSNPELRRHATADTVERLANACLIRTKSESDVSGLLNKCTEQRGLIGAKSEICLQTISSHNYNPITPHSQPLVDVDSATRNTHSTYTELRTGIDTMSSASGTASSAAAAAQRRRSECSLSSVATSYSQRTNAMSLSSHSVSTDPNAVTRVPIIGYEVMEERARFTVYKLRVENPHTNDCWLVMRRYTDFVRLNTKLKQAYPHITLLLPRKKIFGDNFNAVFLDNRVQGLQMFVNSVMAKEELRKCKLVREFFCLDEPPSYSESMEECRAIFEAQEETIAHLKLQINSKNEFILSLQQKLREEMSIKDELKEAFKNLASGNPTCVRCGSSAALNTQSK